jgi:hypothetical protein
MYVQNRRPAVGEGTNNQSTQQTPWSVLRKEVTMMMEQSRRPAGWLKVRIMTGSMEFYHPLLLVDIHFLGAISLQLFHIIGSRLHYHYGTLAPPPTPSPKVDDEDTNMKYYTKIRRTLLNWKICTSAVLQNDT